MYASRAASRPEAAPARSVRDDEAVSEIVGQMLMFGILSMVLILSLLGFNAAKAGAEDRVAALEAESIAQRVAGVYVSASLFAEEHATQAVRYERVVDLPERVQERSYTVSIQSESLVLDIPSLGIQVSESLLSAGAATELAVCNQVGGEAAAGGPLRVVAEPYDAADPDQPSCTNRGSATLLLYLESA